MLIALVWCTLVSISRIYLGVHSFADIYMGLIVGLMLLVPVLPLAEYSDFWLLSSPYAPFVLTAIELLGLYFYPGSDRWTPARCVRYRKFVGKDEKARHVCSDMSKKLKDRLRDTAL